RRAGTGREAAGRRFSRPWLALRWLTSEEFYHIRLQRKNHGSLRSAAQFPVLEKIGYPRWVMRSLFEPERIPASAPFQLNPAQKRAVEHGDGPLLVIAGAGTGKTRVITERIRSLFERDDSLKGENVLALTYTIKAAGEMLRRVKKACGERARGITINTFHGFCEAILEEAAPHRKPIAPVDHWILLRRNM